MRAADDIHFDGAITAEEFAKFSRVIAQGIYADPIQPARASGLLHFDIGMNYYLKKHEMKLQGAYQRTQFKDDAKPANNELIFAAQVNY